MTENLFQIETGIFSLSYIMPCGHKINPKPFKAKELLLLVQPFAGIPLDQKGMKNYVNTLYQHKAFTKEAREYEIGIKVLLSLCEYPIVTLEEEHRIKDWANLPYNKNRIKYFTGDSYIVSVGKEELRPNSNFPAKLSRFLGRFDVDKINVIGKCNKGVMNYLSKLPAVNNGGIEKKLKFVPSEDESLQMTPQRNPLGYERYFHLLGKQH